MHSLGELPYLLSQIFQFGPEPLFIKDTEFRYAYVNAACLKLMGCTEAEAIGHTDYEIAAFQGPGLRKAIDLCRANDQAVFSPEFGSFSSLFKSEETYETPAGTFYYDISRQKFVDSHGKPYIFGVVTDITELRRSQLQRQESEERFHDLLELIDEVLWSAEWPSGKIVYASTSMEKVYGLPVSEFQRNEDWLKIYSVQELEKIATMMWGAVQNNVPQFSGEFTFTHPVKGNRVAFVRGSVHRDETGKAVRIDGMISDVTALQQAKAELQEHREKIFALSKLNTLGELASGIGHEINTPLSGILSKIARVEHQLSESGSNPTSIRLLRESMALVERISEIVEGLKQLSKNEGSEATKTFSPLLALEQALSLSRARFSNHGIRISIQNFLPVDTRVVGKPTSLFQVLVNLLNNAFDALEENPSGGLVQIEIEAVDGKVLIRVNDNGIGISEQFRPLLFQAFQTTKVEGKGTGLGLSISRRLLRAMNGDLQFLPRTDGMTSFEVMLAAEKKGAP